MARLNALIARATNLSRRAADTAIENGRVKVNGETAALGQTVTGADTVTLDGKKLTAPTKTTTIILHKPVGYVCSRNGQGSPTIYDLLPTKYRHLNPVGRLDKNTSGLLILTDDGQLNQQLTHPKFEKDKVYEVELDSELLPKHVENISGGGVKLDDGLSRLKLEYMNDDGAFRWRVTMHEGRNRQVRRTFDALGYKVLALHRTRFGPFKLGKLDPGSYLLLDAQNIEI